MTHIINSSIEHECVFLDEIKYLHVKIEDSYQENIYRVINKALKFIDDAFDKYYADLAAYNDEKAAAAAAEQQQQQQQQNSSNGKTSNSRQSSANTTTTSSSTPTMFYLGTNKNSSNNLESTNKTNRSSSIKSLTKPKRPVFLIHCNLGISRSSSILIAYMINKYKLCLYAAFNYVKDKRLQIAPNYSFLRQLKQFEEEFY